MRFMRTTLALVAVVLLGSAGFPVFAEAPGQPTQQPDAHRRFNLSAMVTAKPQLSRAEIDPAAVGAAGLAMPPANPAQFPPQVSADGGAAGRLAALAAQARMAAMQGQQMPGQMAEDDAPGAFMKEYNVDWSRWVSIIADRWFYVLRNAEYQMGVQFATARPALIQYTCYADGTIGNIILKQSSGVPAYDRLQVASLLQAVPTPPFPAGTRRRSITLVQGWESHPRRPGEEDFQPGSFGRDFPLERVRKWCAGLQ